MATGPDWSNWMNAYPFGRRKFTEALEKVGLTLSQASEIAIRIVHIPAVDENDWEEWFLLVPYQDGFVLVGGGAYDVFGGHDWSSPEILPETEEEMQTLLQMILEGLDHWRRVDS